MAEEKIKSNLKRVVEMIGISSNQPDGARLDVDCQRYEALTITLQAFGAAGANLIIAPSPYSGVVTDNAGTAIAAPGSGGTVHIGLGKGCRVGIPVPTRLAVSFTAAGGQATIQVDGERYEPMPEVNERLQTIFNMVDRLTKLLEFGVDLLRKKK